MQQVNWPRTIPGQTEDNSFTPFKTYYSTYNRVKLERRQESTTNSRRCSQAQHFSSSEV